MSIDSLTDTEIRRSKKLRQSRAQDDAGDRLARSGAQGDADDKQATNTLSMLVKYIPTESITLYVASLSAVAALQSFSPRITQESIYWFFAVLTPLLVLVIYFGKRRVAKLRPTVPAFLQWPWWKTIAATIAFLVWALAVPSNPYIDGALQSALVGFLAIFVSTILSVFDPWFDRPAEA